MINFVRRKEWKNLSTPTLILLASALIANWPLIDNRNEVATARTNLAVGLLREGKTTESLAEFRRALDTEPGNIAAANNLAWIYATHPDPAIRNGVEAVRLSRGACQATDFSDP